MSEAVATTKPEPPESQDGGPLTDFKDWLSPMLVKELRQGLRTRVFVMAFILMQASIMVVMLGAAANGSAGEATNFVWVVAALVMLAAMPLRGFSALSNEMRMQTMDLLTLTRLSAFRISLGKWAALYSQTLLLAVALMPYIVIRYFLGGVDLATEITALFVITVLSGLLTAVTVGFSAHPSVLLRGAVVVVIGFVGGAMVIQLFEVVFQFGRSPVSDEEFWLLMAAFVFFAVFCSYYLLDMGASQFAPFAENHSTRKRLAALAFMFAMTMLAVFAEDRDIPEGVFWMLVVSMSVVCVDAMTERPAPVPSLYAPFVRRGALGKLYGRMFYPGWHTGLLFTGLVVLVMTVYGVGFEVDPLDDGDEGFAFWVAAIGMLLFPVVLIHLFFRNASAPFAMYVLIQCITLPLVGLLASIDRGEGLLWIACPIPMAQMFLIGGWRYDDGAAMALPFLFTGGYFVLLLVFSFAEHRKVKVLEARAEAALKES